MTILRLAVSFDGCLAKLLHANLIWVTVETYDDGLRRVVAEIPTFSNLHHAPQLIRHALMVRDISANIQQVIRAFLLSWLDHELRENIVIEGMPTIFRPHYGVADEPAKCSAPLAWADTRIHVANDDIGRLL